MNPQVPIRITPEKAQREIEEFLVARCNFTRGREDTALQAEDLVKRLGLSSFGDYSQHPIVSPPATPEGGTPKVNDGFPMRSPDYREGFGDGLRAQRLIDERELAEAEAQWRNTQDGYVRLQGELTDLRARLATAEATIAESRDQWRMSSVCRELTEKLEKAEKERDEARAVRTALFGDFADDPNLDAVRSIKDRQTNWERLKKDFAAVAAQLTEAHAYSQQVVEERAEYWNRASRAEEQLARLTAPASPATPDPDNLQSHRALAMMSVSPATTDKRVEEATNRIYVLTKKLGGDHLCHAIADELRHFTTPTQ
jgi:hypothetical protein